ncbi:hypothetical protein SASPL_157021 [Salvia splendens]|uniref:Solute carrier family 25 (Mitochondrial oxoglutarate transporter), member 11 n=1 Tax=Salvia splendens TaxID=180675 RepID=A0A8X8YUX0_SALSN|nr:hypothetical protein SASPL_157021 [Salvia splendens]
MSKNEGIGSLWRWSSLTVNHAMVVTASQLASYNQFKEFVKNEELKWMEKTPSKEDEGTAMEEERKPSTKRREMKGAGRKREAALGEEAALLAIEESSLWPAVGEETAPAEGGAGERVGGGRRISVDRIKTHVMNMKAEAGKAPLYNGAVDCVVNTVKAEGLMPLYKGFIPTVSRQGPHWGLFVTLEQIRKLVKDFLLNS